MKARRPSRAGRRTAGDAPGRKTRITIRLDEAVLAWFRRHAGVAGGGYQSLINLALRDHIGREELARAEGHSTSPDYGSDRPPVEWVADSKDPKAEYGASLKRGRRRRRGRKD